MTPDAAVDLFRRLKILPVLVIDDAAQAVPLARALAEGGLPAAEVTFRTAGAAEAIRRIATEVPEVALGAGTVLTPRRVDEAREAGARFVVAPGLNPAVVERARDRGLPVFPGVCTPTEIERALGLGLTALKFFPAEPMGGPAFLEAVGAPYGDVRFMPTGGITAATVGDYLRLEQVICCGGSWMAPRERIAAGDVEWIRAETARAVRAAAGASGIPGQAAAAPA